MKKMRDWLEEMDIPIQMQSQILKEVAMVALNKKRNDKAVGIAWGA